MPKRVKRGCPLGMVETDPEDTDDEYYDRCITAYRNKPAGYEATVKKEIGKEKAKRPRKRATPRQADSQESDLSDGDAQSKSSSAASSSQTSSSSTTESGSRHVVVPETSPSETELEPTQESPQRNSANQTTPPTNENNHTAKHSGLLKASQSLSSSHETSISEHTACSAILEDNTHASITVPVAKNPPVSDIITMSSGSEDDTVSSPMVKQEPLSSDEDLLSGLSHNDEEQDIRDLSKLTEGLTAQDFESDF